MFHVFEMRIALVAVCYKKAVCYIWRLSEVIICSQKSNFTYVFTNNHVNSRYK